MKNVKSVWKKRESRSISHFINHKIADHISRRSYDLMQQRANKQMAIFANDYIGIQINQFGYFEGDELNILFEYLSPLVDIFEKGIALDIGANIGNHSMFFSTRFRNVHAYEPNPRTHRLLKFNIESLANVTCYQLGVGDATGSFALHQDLANPGLASIKYNSDSRAPIVNIQVSTLDELEIPEKEALCFIKMDVEGFEENVIKGGEQTLRHLQPVVVLEQHHGEFTHQGTTPAIQRLKNLGYTFCWEKKNSPSSTWLGRRLQDVRECVTGKQIEFVAGNDVPPANYTMLIAIPERFKQKMKL
jgi:FkbM family methyltransferase